jgi:hypothetical protein
MFVVKPHLGSQNKNTSVDKRVVDVDLPKTEIKIFLANTILRVFKIGPLPPCWLYVVNLNLSLPQYQINWASGCTTRG